MLLTTCQHLTTFEIVKANNNNNNNSICRNRQSDREQSSASIVNNLKSMFARHGIPEMFVTDNGPQYSSQTFCAFTDAHGFTHRTSSPRYPQSNRVSERAVKKNQGSPEEERGPV